MEETIVVRESKKTICHVLLIYIILWVFVGVFGLWTLLSETEVLDFEFFLILIIGVGWTFPVVGLVAASYFLRRLELSYSNCFYRTMFGRKRSFLLQDIAMVKTKGSPQGGSDLYLIGNDNEVIAKIEMNMVGAEKVIPFFETYNFSAEWTKQDWSPSNPVKINPIEDELVVRANGARRNLCLILTPGQCSFTDKKGRTSLFYLKDVTRITKTEDKMINNKVTTLRIWLISGNMAAEVPYTAAMENVTDIIPFVEYHQKRRIKE